MNLSVVSHADRLRGENGAEPRIKYSLQYALNVAKKLKFLFNPIRTDRFIVGTAMLRRNRLDNAMMKGGDRMG